MTQEQILEGNKLIAEFMGCDIKTNKDGLIYMSPLECEWLKIPHNCGAINPNNLKYHTSWDWLMSVVEKIENLEVRYSVSIRENSCDIHNVYVKDTNINIYRVEDLKIKSKSTYEAVIDFIKWYNENKKT